MMTIFSIPKQTVNQTCEKMIFSQFSIQWEKEKNTTEPVNLYCRMIFVLIIVSCRSIFVNICPDVSPGLHAAPENYQNRSDHRFPGKLNDIYLIIFFDLPIDKESIVHIKIQTATTPLP